MNIKIKNFIIEPDPVDKVKFNLFQFIEYKNKKTGKVFMTKKNIAWGILLSRAMDIISNELIEDKEIEDIKKYVDEKIEVIKSLLDEFNKPNLIKKFTLNINV